MAEVVGTIASAITLASVFKACLNAFDLFQTAQKADQDLKRLLVRLNIERCRLYTWGEAMGFTGPRKRSLLETATCRELVKDTLEAMEQLFQDSDKFQVRYGCKEVKEALSRRKPTGLDDSDPMDDLAASFSHFYVPETSNTPSKPQRTKVLTKVRWAIHDRKKFDGLIREVKDLVDGLQNITDSIFATSRQGGMLRFGIQQIKNLDTLEIISAACEEDYPDISDAATVKMDVMTVGNFQSQDVQDWLDGTQEAEDDSILQTVPKPNPGSDAKNSLNAIVCEYLLKKGYTDARAVLIAETWAVPDTKPAQSEANTAVAKRKPDAAQDNTTNDQASTSSGKRRRVTRQTSRTPASTQHS